MIKDGYLRFRDFGAHQSSQFLVPVHPGGLWRFSSSTRRGRRGGEADTVALPRCSGSLLPVTLLCHLIKIKLTCSRFDQDLSNLKVINSPSD